MKMMPIRDGWKSGVGYITYELPFDIFEDKNHNCLKYHSQTAQQLYERHGVSSKEALCILIDISFKEIENISDEKAKEQVLGYYNMIKNKQKEK